MKKSIEEQIKENEKRNEKYLNEFKEWLNSNNLSKKTIKKHLDNASLYINDYLTYYKIIPMEEGVNSVYSFLDGWFIEKCLWSSKTEIKETAASIKKFYKCMSEKGYVKADDYKSLCEELKDNMDDFLSSMEEYDDGTYYDLL